MTTGHFTNQQHSLNAIGVLDRALYADQHPARNSLAIKYTINRARNRFLPPSMRTQGNAFWVRNDRVDGALVALPKTLGRNRAAKLVVIVSRLEVVGVADDLNPNAHRRSFFSASPSGNLLLGSASATSARESNNCCKCSGRSGAFCASASRQRKSASAIFSSELSAFKCASNCVPMRPI
jgi:hypothetical protein